MPAKSLQELIALARREPGKLGYGSGGAGTPNHLVGAMFSNAANVSLIHVPFRGAGPAVAALVGNHVAMMFAGLPSVIGNIKSGVLRPLAVTSLKRIAALPDVPTAAEAGLPGFEAAQRYGLIAPAGLPPAITAKLSAALREALTSDEVKARIDAEGAEPLPSTPEDYVKDIESEWVKWSKVVKDAGVDGELNPVCRLLVAASPRRSELPSVAVCKKARKEKTFHIRGIAPCPFFSIVTICRV